MPRSIQIRVFDGTHQKKPIEAAMVRVCEGSEEIQRNATDNEGRVDFSDVPMTALQIEVSGQVYNGATIRSTQTYEHDEHGPLNFYLHDDANPYFSHLGGPAPMDQEKVQEAREMRQETVKQQTDERIKAQSAEQKVGVEKSKTPTDKPK